MDIWIIDDDKHLFDNIKCNFDEVCLEKFTITRFSSLPDAINKEGSPDMVLIDVTAIGGYDGASPIGNWTLYEMNLQHFVKNHRGSIIAIYSGLTRWACDLVENIQESMDDVKIFFVKPRMMDTLKEFLDKFGYKTIKYGE